MNVGDSVTFDYTGSIQTFSVTNTGLYKLEVWGAKGGSFQRYSYMAEGGNGGYSVGYIKLERDAKLYVVVGGNNGYNGGGSSCNYYDDPYTRIGASGGGATHIAKVTGRLSDIGKTSFDQNGLIVAGGGGGGFYGSAYTSLVWGRGGAGGGTSGGTSARTHWQDVGGMNTANGGTQVGGNAFGLGGSNSSGSGGGGGYFGGYTGSNTCGGGGSGYIGGVPSITYRGITYSPSTTQGTNNGQGKATITLIAKTNVYVGENPADVYLGSTNIDSIYLGDLEI